MLPSRQPGVRLQLPVWRLPRQIIANRLGGSVRLKARITVGCPADQFQVRCAEQPIPDPKLRIPSCSRGPPTRRRDITPALICQAAAPSLLSSYVTITPKRNSDAIKAKKVVRLFCKNGLIRKLRPNRKDYGARFGQAGVGPFQTMMSKKVGPKKGLQRLSGPLSLILGIVPAMPSMGTGLEAGGRSRERGATLVDNYLLVHDPRCMDFAPVSHLGLLRRHIQPVHWQFRLRLHQHGRRHAPERLPLDPLSRHLAAVLVPDERGRLEDPVVIDLPALLLSRRPGRRRQAATGSFLAGASGPGEVPGRQAPLVHHVLAVAPSHRARDSMAAGGHLHPGRSAVRQLGGLRPRMGGGD